MLVGPERAGRCAVTFTQLQPDPAVQVLLDLGVRTGDTPLVLTGPGPRSVTVDLPADVVLSYRFVHTAPGRRLPLTTDAERIALADDGVPDTDATVERIGPVFGRPHGSSVLTGPRATTHPAWQPGPVVARGHRGSRVTPAGRRVDSWTPTRPRWVVVLLDGQDWVDALGLPEALDRWGRDDVAVLAVRTPDRAVLADRAAVVQLVGEALVGCPVPPDRRVVAGQSLGGLAAVTAVLDAPGLAGTALAQSGSFWLDPALPGEVHPTGDCRPRLVLQAGTDEPDLLDQARELAAAARASGLSASVRAVTGGHDHAWYRHHLLQSLEEIASRDCCMDQ